MKGSFWLSLALGFLATSGAAVVPQLYMSPNYVTVAENAGTASVSIVLSPPVSTAVAVDSSTSDVYPGPSPAAQAGVHYQAQSGTLTFQPVMDQDDPNWNHRQPGYKSGARISGFSYNPVGGVLDVSGPSYAYVQIYDNELPNLVTRASTQARIGKL